jgi:hypothetical protein
MPTSCAFSWRATGLGSAGRRDGRSGKSTNSSWQPRRWSRSGEAARCRRANSSRQRSKQLLRARSRRAGICPNTPSRTPAAQFAAHQLGAATAALLAGLSRDVLLSYLLSFDAAGTACLGALGVLFARLRAPRRWRARIERHLISRFTTDHASRGSRAAVAFGAFRLLTLFSARSAFSADTDAKADRRQPPFMAQMRPLCRRHPGPRPFQPRAPHRPASLQRH